MRRLDGLRRRHRHPFLVAIPIGIVFLLMSGCASVLSPDTLRQVSRDIPPSAVLNDPQQFIGRVIVVAGTILRTENLKEGTLIDVLAYPTSRGDEPDLSEPAIGRFMLLYPGFLDGLVYQQGRQVVAAGRVIGQRAESVGGAMRPFPLLKPLEIELLSEPAAYPAFSFGVGLGFGF